MGKKQGQDTQSGLRSRIPRNSLLFLLLGLGFCEATGCRDTPAPASPIVGSPLPVVTVVQEEASGADCGPRALKLVCNRLNITVSLEELRRLAGTDAAGTSMEGMARACHALGLQAEGVQITGPALAHIPLPAIVLVQNNHYVALLAVQREGLHSIVIIHDPNQPTPTVQSAEQLLQQSEGYLLLIQR